MYVLLPTGRQARRGSNWFLQHFLHSGGGGCGGGSGSCERACCQRTHAWYWCMGELKQNWLITPSRCRFFATMDNRRPCGWLNNGCGGEVFFFLPFKNLFSCLLMSWMWRFKRWGEREREWEKDRERGKDGEWEQSGLFTHNEYIPSLLLKRESLVFFGVTDFQICSVLS